MWATLALFAAAGPHAADRIEAQPPVSRARYVMGTRCEASAFGVEAGGAIEAALDEISRLDRVLSDYREESELSRLNRAAGGSPVACSADLYEFVAAAERFSRETEGAFDITVGPLVDLWDLRGKGRNATPAEVAERLLHVGWGRIARDDASRSIQLPPRMRLDPGALGKGLALDAAVRVLISRGVTAALLDFGGQVIALGAPPGEEAWEVSVAHPLCRDEGVVTLRLRDASISTSGNSERRLDVEGRELGHIVDPRTGLPVAGHGSATVIAPTGAEADAFSTALFVMGPEEGLRWAERRAGIAALYLETDGAGRLRASATRNLATYHPSGLPSGGVDSVKGSR